VVKQGQLLAELSAPEMAARIAEAESRVHGAQSDRIQAEAQLAAAQSTWDKLKKAAETRESSPATNLPWRRNRWMPHAPWWIPGARWSPPPKPPCTR